MVCLDPNLEHLEELTVDKINQLYQRVSLEARADTNDQSIFGTQFGRLVEGLKNHATGLVGNNVFGFNSNLGNINTNEDYMNIRNVSVYRPMHLAARAKMIDYVKAVKANFEAQRDIEVRILAPWRGMLANFLTNPNTLSNIYDPADLKNGKLIKFTDLDKLKANLKKVHTASKTQPTETFGNLYSNVKEWGEVTKTTGKLNEEVVRLNFEGIVRQIDELYDMAGRLAENIGSGDERYQSSKSALALLADASFMVAQELEFLGATGTMLDSLSGSIASTVEVLKK